MIHCTETPLQAACAVSDNGGIFCLSLLRCRPTPSGNCEMESNWGHTAGTGFRNGSTLSLSPNPEKSYASLYYPLKIFIFAVLDTIGFPDGRFEVLIVSDWFNMPL